MTLQPTSPHAPSISVSSPASTASVVHSAPPTSVQSSRQNSFDIPRHSSPRPLKRNRSALRQFYGLSASGEILPELDRDDFFAEIYVAKLLAEKGVRQLLQVENELINDIRGLDGERKALVYDNYSKLIAATDTIRRMRASMEPLTPTTSTLEPAVSHIEAVSRGLVEGMRVASPRPVAEHARSDQGAQIVKWALEAPERIRGLIDAGKMDQAKDVWDLLQKLCEKWQDTRGLQQLRRSGEQAFTGKSE